mmetsp:Transcript_10336/g.15442  ORF Transcript_10336/g.15442 Transcript_10336/m.15442 type:complete len:376 (-) Transcript_10336:25-1152(-)
MQNTLKSEETFLTDTNLAKDSFESQGLVFKLEDAKPPVLRPGVPSSLPENVNLSRVIDNIFTTLESTQTKFNDKNIRKRWNNYFMSEDCKEIISSMFWFTILELEKDGYSNYKQQLLDRICKTYLNLFLNVPKEDKEMFFRSFYDCIAQAVFYSMFFAYPKSRSKMNTNDFKSNLYSLVAESLTGVSVCNHGYTKWVLDLGAGNILEKKEAAPTPVSESLPPMKNLKTTSVFRKTLRMRYSPFVERYLKNKNYQTLNSVKTWNMKFSSRDVNREQEVADRFLHNKRLAAQIEKGIQNRSHEYSKFSKKIDRDIKSTHNSYAKEIENIRNRTEQIIKKKSAKKYANKIMSKWIKTKEENPDTKAGNFNYINLLMSE